MRVEKTVFISYRRTNVFHALAIYQNLIHNGYDVFFDYDSIKSGDFGQIILNQIAARAHFVVLLTPSALERCNEPGDWLRKEIEHAIDLKRNIVPVMFEGFNFNDMDKYLTGKLELVKNYNAMRVPADYFNAAMDRLRNDYLNIALDAVIHPIPATDLAAVAVVQQQAAEQPKPSENQLTAEEWFEKGLRRAEIDYDGKIVDYTEAIRLNPQFAVAYNNRGLARYKKGDLNGAIADYSEAIQLNPQFAAAYNMRGIACYDKGSFDDAIADYTRSIELGHPELHLPYVYRGIARKTKGDIDGAIADYDEAIRLNPHYAAAYRNRGVAYKEKGNLQQSNKDYQLYIDLGGKDSVRVKGYIRKNEAKLRRQGK